MSAQDDIVLHEEELPFPLTRYVELLFWGLVILFLSLVYFQAMFGPVGERPAPTVFYLGMAAIFAGTAMLMRNMKVLRVRISERLLDVSFGIFHQRFRWEHIDSCDHDSLSWLRYGGFGIRYTRANGVWRRVYNVIGPERVVIRLKRGRFHEFAFSTRQPDRIITLVGERIRRSV